MPIIHWEKLPLSWTPDYNKCLPDVSCDDTIMFNNVHSFLSLVLDVGMGNGSWIDPDNP